jgi:membrane-associated phospholipid phosphatase
MLETDILQNSSLRKTSYLTAVDGLFIAFLLPLSLLVFLFAPGGTLRWILPLCNLGVIGIIFCLANLSQRSPYPIIHQLHAWYGFPLLLGIYKEMYWAVHALRTELYDSYLIQIDRMLFGTDPTVALMHIAHPALTEFLQIVYMLFYLFPLAIVVALIRKQRMQEFFYASFLILYGFFLSYIGYILVPAVGPRFTLHDFYALNEELPGLWLTPYLREFVNRGESITSTLPDAIEKVQRDVFPSGHTLITLITIHLSYLFKSRTRYILTPLGIALIFSTVYLRYHYVIDVIAAGVLFPFILWSGKKLFNYWETRNGRSPLS